VFDALTSARPYKNAWSLEQAFDYLIEQSGKHFDPDLVNAMLSIRDAVKKIHDEHKEIVH
jgi:HD-GYP domain-containing protein (c-di-GMP phosphodiesterase class II)